MNITTVGVYIAIGFSIILFIYGIIVYLQITGMKSQLNELENTVNRIMMELDDRKEEASNEKKADSVNESNSEDTEPSWNSNYTSVD